MRRRARADLCGGRSAMIVPTATKWLAEPCPSFRPNLLLASGWDGWLGLLAEFDPTSRSRTKVKSTLTILLDLFSLCL
jgi:hypothetical protein